MPINTELRQIQTAGRKDVPQGTAVDLRLGSLPGTVKVRIKLPGQREFKDLGDLRIKDGIVELPVKLVFLSYAREDQDAVMEIAEKLWQDGFLTWFDKKDLLPGDDWKSRIEDTIERADYVLVFLSQASVSKTGYIQKEFKYALEQKDLRPSRTRYIIPILLEPCDPPREFKDIHWLKYWEQGAYTRLKEALT